MMLMPIGRFSRASRLSVKSLRNYDESGLLQAAFVDPRSGYRYYRLEQLRAAETIRALRALDLPLEQIAEVLAGDESEETLTSHLAALEEQRDEYDRKSQDLRRLIVRKELTVSETVFIKTIPAQTVGAYRSPTTQETVFSDIPDGFSRVLLALRSAGVDPAGPPFTVFYQAPDADTRGDIEACVPIRGAFQGCPDVEVFRFDEMVVAAIVHRGPYEDMAASYAAISTWIHQYGHRIAGSTREIYLNSPADVSAADLLTEIQFPIDPDTGEE